MLERSVRAGCTGSWSGLLSRATELSGVVVFSRCTEHVGSESWLERDHLMALDLLVCNHMFTPADTPPILDMRLETHHRMLDINPTRTRRSFTASGISCGSVVIVSSAAGLTSAPVHGRVLGQRFPRTPLRSTTTWSGSGVPLELKTRTW
ncbi:hypothetical protein ACFQ68_07390 [Amycolatopsis japonica]|uniref:hypothetical protein n=1 Tax=Amycolatopsis japonica TaxID=208439 RepID=UPI00366EB5F6